MTDLYEPPTSSEFDVELGSFDEPVSERRTLLTWLVAVAVAAAVAAAIGYVFIAMDKAQTTTTIDSASTDETSALAAAQPGTSDFTESDAGNLSHEGSFEESKNFPVELVSSHVVRTEENTLLTYRVFRDHTDDSFTTTAERSRDGETWEPVTMRNFPAGKLMQIDDHGGLLVAFVIDYSVDMNGDSYFADSRDGLDWTPTDAASLELNELPDEGRDYPYRLASYGDTTYRTTTNADELAIQRSSDGGRTWTDTAPIDPGASVTELAVGPAGVALLAFPKHDLASPDNFPRTPFDYRDADGTHLTGELPGAYTTWVLTTPTGETFTYELAPSIQFAPGSGDDYGDFGETDPNVVVEFSSQGVPWYTLLSPIDGSTLLTVEDGDLWMAADHDATIEPAADQFGSGPVLYFSADDGATWEFLDSPGLKVGPIAVGDDEVLIANSGDTDGMLTRIAVPTN